MTGDKAGRIRLAQVLSSHGAPLPAVDALVVDRPELADLPAAGVVVRESLRWSA